MEDIMGDLNNENLMLNHAALAKRIKRSLYYDPIKNPDKDTLSFSLTKFAVEDFQNAAPSRMKKLGHRYAARVARDACISPCSLLLGLIYIERLKTRNSDYLSSISSSDLFLISMMVASKYLYDEGVDEEVFNDEWASSGGMKVSEINKLERDFLHAVDWTIYVNPQEFTEVLTKAEASIARLNGLNRGWMTYSDLRSLFDFYDVIQHLNAAAKCLYKFSGIFFVAYGGFVLATCLSSYALHMAKQAKTTSAVVEIVTVNNINTETENNVDVHLETNELEENPIVNKSGLEMEFLKKENFAFAAENTKANIFITEIRNDIKKLAAVVKTLLAMGTVTYPQNSSQQHEECAIKSDELVMQNQSRPTTVTQNSIRCCKNPVYENSAQQCVNPYIAPSFILSNYIVQLSCSINMNRFHNLTLS